MKYQPTCADCAFFDSEDVLGAASISASSPAKTRHATTCLRTDAISLKWRSFLNGNVMI